MAQSTRPASANGSARQDTRAAGRPARSSADGAVRSLPEPRPRAQAMARPGRSPRQPARGWKPSPPPGSAKSGAARIGWARAGPPWRTPARISSMICGSTCAGCARCPTCCHGRQARAPCVARCARKWPGPCSRCRGRAIGTSSRWKCCRSSAMPIRISIRKPRRARARSEIAHDEMYANLQTERFQAMLRLLRERSAEIPAAMAERAPRSLSRARPPPRGLGRGAARAPG